MELQGKIIAVLPIKSGTSKSGKEWRSQEYVIETEGQYPKKICFSAFGDKIEEFDIKVGDSLKALIDIDAHEYQGRWYNAVRAYKIEKEGTAPRPTVAKEKQQKAAEIFPPKQEEKQEPIQGAEDLPF